MMRKFGLEFIKKLKPCSWRYNPGPLSDGKDHLGLVAQDVNEIVDKKKYAFVVLKNGFYAINYNEFIGPLIKSVQELEKKVARLEKEKRITEVFSKQKKDELIVSLNKIQQDLEDVSKSTDDQIEEAKNCLK